jgi:hypothetical protein
MNLRTHIQGTTLDGGIPIQISIDGAPLDLTDITLTAFVTLKGNCNNKKDVSISDIVELTGSFIILKDEVIRWTKGFWELTVIFTNTNGDIEKYIYPDDVTRNITIQII